MYQPRGVGLMHLGISRVMLTIHTERPNGARLLAREKIQNQQTLQSPTRVVNCQFACPGGHPAAAPMLAL